MKATLKLFLGLACLVALGLLARDYYEIRQQALCAHATIAHPR